MAASMVGLVVGSNEVARCLYALTLMNMQHIASGDSMNLRVITLGHAQSADQVSLKAQCWYIPEMRNSRIPEMRNSRCTRIIEMHNSGIPAIP